MATIIQSETSLHSFSAEEVSGIVEYINELLRDDKDLKNILPVDPNSDDIFDAVKDGILTW